ncbi:MAG TPA: SpoIIE family protein phosphatase [Candidatus Eremiobacteraceae bacterium]|nr:SpoIIE family protein phosphatase [Candidatus Eremiobacteraceae bacterium]
MRSGTGSRSLPIWTAIGVIAFCIVVIAFLTIGLALRQAAAASFVAEARNREARGLIFTALKDQLDEETGVRGYEVTHAAEFVEPYDIAREDMPRTMTQLIDDLNTLGLSDAASAALDMMKTNRQWTVSVAGPLTTGTPVNSLELEQLGKALVDRFRREETIVDDALTMQYSDFYNASERQLDYIGALVVMGALLILGVGLIFTRLQTRAWDRLAEERDLAEEGRRREAALRSAYETERRIAERFQRALAHRDFPRIPWLEFSATYAPASEEAKVGGDWYDVFALSADRALVVIGDIAGHGIDAALAMNRVRNAVLSAALFQPDSASILEYVNREVVHDESVMMATATVGIVDSRTNVFEYASAGHPPPVLLASGGLPRMLDVGSLPLGVSESTKYRSNRVESAPGSMLVLYTDGAIERSRDVLEGERRLLEAVKSARDERDPHPASAIFRSITEVGEMNDDVAILTISIVDDGATGRIMGARESSTISPRRTQAAGGDPAPGATRGDGPEIAFFDRLRMIA